MNAQFDPDTNANAKCDTGREDCTDPVQPPSLSARLGRLGAWMAARIKAHEDRIISLRIYRQDRLDGGVSDGRKDA
jgi:hypothetical protein